MGVVVVSVVVALVLAVVVAGIVVVGMRGELPEVSERAPELAGRFEWAARHLNGDAAPSQRMVDLEQAVSARLASRRNQRASQAAPQAALLPTANGARTGSRTAAPRTSAPLTSGLPASGDFGAS